MDKIGKIKPPKQVEKIKIVADTADPPVVIPVVLIAVAVHVALIVPTIEGEIAGIIQSALNATALRNSLGAVSNPAYVMR